MTKKDHMSCPNCKREIKASASFCRHCRRIINISQVQEKEKKDFDCQREESYSINAYKTTNIQAESSYPDKTERSLVNNSEKVIDNAYEVDQIKKLGDKHQIQYSTDNVCTQCGAKTKASALWSGKNIHRGREYCSKCYEKIPFPSGVSQPGSANSNQGDTINRLLFIYKGDNCDLLLYEDKLMVLRGFKRGKTESIVYYDEVKAVCVHLDAGRNTGYLHFETNMPKISDYNQSMLTGSQNSVVFTDTHNSNNLNTVDIIKVFVENKISSIKSSDSSIGSKVVSYDIDEDPYLLSPEQLKELNDKFLLDYAVDKSKQAPIMITNVCTGCSKKTKPWTGHVIFRRLEYCNNCYEEVINEIKKKEYSLDYRTIARLQDLSSVNITNKDGSLHFYSWKELQDHSGPDSAIKEKDALDFVHKALINSCDTPIPKKATQLSYYKGLVELDERFNLEASEEGYLFNFWEDNQDLLFSSGIDLGNSAHVIAYLDSPQDIEGMQNNGYHSRGYLDSFYITSDGEIRNKQIECLNDIIPIFRIKYDDISFYAKEGEYYTTTEVKSKRDVSAAGFLAGYLAMGPMGALIAGDRGQKVETDTVEVDNRKTVLYYRIQDELCSAFFSKESYDFFKTNFPDKEASEIERIANAKKLSEKYAISTTGDVQLGNQSNADDAYSKLEKLSNLKDKGIITEKEFNEKKEKLLDLI